MDRWTFCGWPVVLAALLGTLSVAPALAASDAVHAVARSVLAVRDNRGLPFAVVDKKAAVMVVYRADGTPLGKTPVLLGRNMGDRSVPGVGERAQSRRLREGDRTTPAGRFASEPGRNRQGEAIVWIDYEAALAIHRLRDGPARQTRAERLASPKPGDKRMSDGCVVVPERFFDTVVHPLLGRSRGVVYVLPEDKPWQAMQQAMLEGAL